MATGHQGDQLDVFFVDHDGALSVAAVSGQAGPWTGTYRISASGFAPVGAPLATGSQTDNQLYVFVVGSDGAVYVVASTKKGPWTGPYALTPKGFARAGSHLATGIQASGGTSQLDLFLVDATGALRVLTVQGLGKWSEFALKPSGFAPPGAPVAAMIQPIDGSQQQLDILAFDNAGRLNLLAAKGFGSWSTFILTPPGQAAPGTPIAAAATATQSYSAFVGADGAVHGLGFSGAGAWVSRTLTQPGCADQRATPALGGQGNGQVDLIVIAKNRRASVFAATSPSAWTGPYAIP